MARYARIDTPCPYKADLAAVMDGDFCRMCQRSVIDLDGMSEGQRDRFLAGCAEEVCVSYTIRPAMMAALAAAAMVPAAAAAQPAPAAPPTVQIAEPVDMPDEDDAIIIVGGIKDPRNARYTDKPADAELPALPVVYDEDPKARAPTTTANRRAKPGGE